MKRIALALLPLLLIGCDGMVKKADNALPIRHKEYNPVGDYVYLEWGRDVHTSLNCYYLSGNPDRIKVSNFSHSHIDIYGNKIEKEYCRYCVSDEQYEWLVALDTIQ